MHLGMLWYDNTPNVTLKNRIEKAVNYYRKKYHQEPNLCLVHPALLEKGQDEVGELTVRSYGPILPGHLWIGIEDNG